MERTNTYLNNIAFAFLMVFAFLLMLSNALAEIFAAGILLIWIIQSLAYRRRNWLDYPLFKPIMALIGFKTLALLVNGYEGPFGTAFEQLSLPLIYFTIPSIVVTAERRRKIIWLVIGGALVAAAIGITKYSTGLDTQASSLVAGCYTLSIYLAISLIIVMAIFVYSQKIKEKLFLGLVSIPLLLGIVLAFTRASYLAAAIAAAFLGFFKDRKLLIPIVLIIVLVAMFSSDAVDFLNRRFDISNVRRFYSHRDVLLMLGLPKADNVEFFGYGINTFPRLIDVQNESSIRSKSINTWHNMYLEYVLDTGPFSLIILMWLFIAQFRYSLYKFRKSRNEEQKLYQLAFMLIVIAIAVIGLFANPMRDPIISMLFWMLMGLSII